MIGYVMFSLLITIAITTLYFKYTFNRRISEFIAKAEDLATMYQCITDSFAEGNISVYYEGIRYRLTVTSNDYENFLDQIEFVVCDVLDAFDDIGNFYLSQMDYELSDYVYQLHESVEQIKYTLRVLRWKHGFTQYE